MAFGVSEELKIVVKAEVDRAVAGLKQVQGTAGGVEGNFKKIGLAAVKYLGPAFLLGAVVKAGRSAVTAAAQYEKLGVSLEVLLGSAEKGQRVFQQLQAFASKTPFQLEQLANVSTRLMAFGSAAENITKELEMLGNASLGMPDKLDRIADAYGKLQAKGKASLEELNMFTEAGVPIMEALRTQLGLTKEELFDYISTGKVGFEDVRVALQNLTTGEGQFAGMMEKQSQTLIGLMSTARDNVQILGAEIGKSLLKPISDIVTGFTNVVTRLSDAIRNASAFKKELKGIQQLSIEEEISSIQAQMNIIGPLVFDESGAGRFLEKQRLRARAGILGVIGQTEKANWLMNIANQSWEESRAMFTSLAAQQMAAYDRLEAEMALTTAPGISPLLQYGGGGGISAGGGIGSSTPINYASAYQVNFGPAGPANSPYNYPYGGINYGTMGGITSPLAMQYGPLGSLLGISPFLPGGGPGFSTMDAMNRFPIPQGKYGNKGAGGFKAGTYGGMGGITSPLAMQYGPLGSLFGISPFLPGGGPGFSGIEAMNMFPIPIDETEEAAEALKKLLSDQKKALEDFEKTIRDTIINTGVDAFVQFAEAVGGGKDALLDFFRGIPGLIGEMTKLIGLQLIQGGLAFPGGPNWPMIAAGLGLAFTGGLIQGAAKNNQQSTGGGSSGGGGNVHVEVHGTVVSERELDSVIINAVHRAGRGY